MTSDLNWREDPNPQPSKPVPPEPARNRPEPPAIQITMPDRPKKPTPPSAREPSRDTAANGIEDMLQRIADKIDESDRRNGDAIADLQGRLDHMDNKAPSSPEEQPDPQTSAGDETHSGVGPDITDTFEDIETQAATVATEAEHDDLLSDMLNGGDKHQETFEEIERRVIEFAEGTRTIEPPEREGMDFDARFQDITSQLEHSLAAPIPVEALPQEPISEAPHAADVVPPMEAAAPPETLKAIEATLGELGGYFDRAEAQYGRLESIETHLNRLIEMMHGAPPGIEQAAQRAAREAVRAFAEDGQLGQALGRFEAIEADLRAFSDRVAQMDARTSDALAAVNNSLSALADRMSSVPPLQAPFAPSDAPETFAEPAPPAQHNLDTVYDEPPFARQAGQPYDAPFAEVRITHGEPTPAATADQAPIYPAQDRVNMDAEPAGDQPLAHQTAAEAPSHQSAQVPPQMLHEEDFIAAARRAAQAASCELDEPAESRGFLSRLKRRAKRTKSDLPLESKKPKPLMVFAALLLLVVSAVLLYSRLSNKQVGTVTGFFEREQAPAGPRAKMSAKLAADPSGETKRKAVAPPRRAAPAQSLRFRLPSDREAENRHIGSSPLSATAAPRTQSIGVSPPMTLNQVTTPTAGRATAAGLPGVLSVLPPHVAPSKAGAETRRDPIAQPPAAVGPASLRSAAAKGDARAQFEVANRFAKGHGVSRDYGEAWRWYHRAAAQSYAPAQYMLAALYERGLGRTRDLAQAKVWYRRAAELGNVKAMHNLAVIYTGRDGKGTDYVQAAEWFGKAAAHGLPDSQFNYGILHENGLGVPKSLIKAYKWFALAAARGDAEAGKRRDLIKLKLAPKDRAETDRAIRQWTPKAVKKSANTISKAGKSWRAARPHAKAERSDLVAQAQALLNKLGYEAGPADGMMGPKTKTAISEFQMRSGLEASGKVSDELIAHLKSLTG